MHLLVLCPSCLMGFTCQREPGQQKIEEEHSGLSKRWELPGVAADFFVVGMKEISREPSQSLVQKLCDEIDVEFTHVNRSTNRHADSLATLASKIKFEDDEDVIKEGDWRHAVIQELKQSVSSVHMARKDWKCFT